MAVRPNKSKKGEIIPRSWVIDFYPEGRKGKQVKRVVNDCSEADALAIEQQLRRRKSGVKNVVNPRIKDVLPDWLEWMRLHRSAKTLESISWALLNLKPHFGDYTVQEITERLVNRYKSKRKDTPRACNLEIDYLKSMISWMVDRKMCEPLSFKIDRLPYQSPIPKIPTPAELKKWLSFIPEDPKKAVIFIMLRSGLRYQEASTLRWENINFADGVIYYQAKRGKPRASILPKEASKILLPIKKKLMFANDDKEPTGWIAPNKRTGEPYTHMKTMFKTASTKSGVPIKGPHTLRHICGTYTLEATDDLRLVQETLGHTQIRTTEKYTQISLQRLKDGQKRQASYTKKLD